MIKIFRITINLLQGRPIPTVLIAVASAPGNFLSRRLIRDTWGNRKSLFNSSDVSISHEVVFVIGKPAIPFENQSISNELIEKGHAVSELIQGKFLIEIFPCIIISLSFILTLILKQFMNKNLMNFFQKNIIGMKISCKKTSSILT